MTEKEIHKLKSIEELARDARQMKVNENLKEILSLIEEIDKGSQDKRAKNIKIKRLNKVVKETNDLKDLLDGVQ